MNAYRCTALLLLMLSWFACKKKDVLKGIDKASLFAPPTAAEINAVEQTWSQRNLAPQDIRIEETQAVNPKLSAYIISFRLEILKSTRPC
ncbi:hypothetical protein [Niabella hibiscisoli]|uniref:hypothetical protein n=1 Tax=Niabella hibiscisoli TaxID=1825928 RepID=UPI001F0E5753|nr:hypothetical protein [Niabella hibiscisoli]MCH5715630.1 hypothetical protein [Niabella hibiscisoli]